MGEGGFEGGEVEEDEHGGAAPPPAPHGGGDGDPTAFSSLANGAGEAPEQTQEQTTDHEPLAGDGADQIVKAGLEAAGATGEQAPEPSPDDAEAEADGAEGGDSDGAFDRAEAPGVAEPDAGDGAEHADAHHDGHDDEPDPAPPVGALEAEAQPPVPMPAPAPKAKGQGKKPGKGQKKTPKANAKDTRKNRLSVAKKLIKLGGTGTKADAKLVERELVKLPLAALKILEKKGTKIVVCRGSVTEYLVALRGVHPRGWPPGATWDTVPGANQPGTNEVVIAVVGHGTRKGAHVPKAGEGHGSHNLVIHETAHAIDLDNLPAGASPMSQSAKFNRARNADLAGLSAYESQAGNAGQEETFAEAAARYYGGDKRDKKRHKRLHKYFERNPFK
jgi:hypothetical protein